MNAAKIIIPFDFPFAILEQRHNPDPKKKLVYAVADGQYTYGPLSLFQYNNDKRYANMNEDEEILDALPCREFYIVESGGLIDDAIEIIDERRGRIYVKEITEEIGMKALIQEISECRDEIRSLKSIVLSSDRTSRRSVSANASPLAQRGGSTIVKRNIYTPPRSQSARTNRVLFNNVKSSGYGQQISPAYATPQRSLRK